MGHVEMDTCWKQPQDMQDVLCGYLNLSTAVCSCSVTYWYADFHSRREGQRKEEWCNHSGNFWQVCVYMREGKSDRQGGFVNTDEEVKRMIVFSVAFLEMETVREENRQRDRMEDRTGGERCRRERFACISLEEMESYYRYTQCCQQLHSESDVWTIAVVLSVNCLQTLTLSQFCIGRSSLFVLTV